MRLLKINLCIFLGLIGFLLSKVLPDNSLYTFLLFFSIIPLIYAAYKYNIITVIICFLLQISLIFLFIKGTGIGFTLFLLFFPTLGLIQGYFIKKKKSIRSIIIITGLVLILILALISVSSFFKVFNMFEYSQNYKITKYKSLVYTHFNSSSIKDEVLKVKYIKIQNYIIENIFKPFSMFIDYLFVFLIFLINLLLFNQIIKKYTSERIEWGEFYKIKLPENMIWVFIFLWNFVMAAYYFKFAKVSFFILNFALSFSFLYLIQGIAILVSFVKKLKIPRIFIIMLVVSVSVMLSAGFELSIFVSVMLTGIGVFDIWLDFRNLFLNTTSNSGKGQNK